MASINSRRKIGKVEANKLQGIPIMVSLLGPTDRSWEDNSNWISSVEEKWEEQQLISKASGCWAVSNQYLASGQLELMYWFESPNDAMLFKLIASSYQ